MVDWRRFGGEKSERVVSDGAVRSYQRCSFNTRVKEMSEIHTVLRYRNGASWCAMGVASMYVAVLYASSKITLSKHKYKSSSVQHDTRL